MYGSYALACVLFKESAFLVLYLSSSHPLMSGGPDSQPDHYLTCNWSTGGVPVLRNGLNRAYCSVSARLKCQF